MRISVLFASVIVAGCQVGSGPCQRAAEVVATCLGIDPPAMAGACDEPAAQALLDQGCAVLSSGKEDGPSLVCRVTGLWCASSEPTPITDHRARIAIVGGGPTGLAAAYELAVLGFGDITLFEANAEVGGKVWTYWHPESGQPYEVGAIIQSDSFDNIFRLARETGYAEEPAEWLKPYPSKANVIDADGARISSFLDYHQKRPGSSSRYTLFDDAQALPEMADLILPIGPVSLSGIYTPGFEDLMVRTGGSSRALRALMQPTDEFMASVPDLVGTSDLSALRGRFSLFFNMCGYGFTSEVPALYHTKFIPMVAKVGVDQVTSWRTSSGIFNARDGYQRLFIHLKDWLRARGVKINLGARVEEIERPLGPSSLEWADADEKKTRISYVMASAQQQEEFDLTIIATPADAARAFLRDATAGEREMFDAVRYYNFVTTIFESDQANMLGRRNGTTFVEDYALDAATTIAGAHLIGLYNNDGSKVFTAYQFARRDATDEEVQAALRSDLVRLGGSIDKVVLVQQWRNYFPHYDTTTLTAGAGAGQSSPFLQRVLALQGSNRTLFLQAQFDFESTEHMAGFARRTIRRYFQ